MDDLLPRYFKDICAYPLLSREQEVELGKKARGGDEKARERIILSNLRLVVKVARAYEFMGLPLMDLISEGNIGLAKVAEKFDPENFKNKFSSFACWYIKSWIRKALINKSRIVRLPSHIGQKMPRIFKARDELWIRFRRIPSAAEIAEESGVSENFVRALFELNTVSSTDEMADEDGELHIGIENHPSQQMVASELSSQLRGIVDSLPWREREIISKRFGLDGQPPASLEEIGAVFGVTRERIRQIEKKALRRLKKMAKKIV